jgi:hypothetical protein
MHSQQNIKKGYAVPSLMEEHRLRVLRRIFGAKRAR